MSRDDHEVEKDPGALVREAERCRRLAESLTDSRTVETLRLMAQDYERRAGDARQALA